MRIGIFIHFVDSKLEIMEIYTESTQKLKIAYLDLEFTIIT